MSPVLGAQPEAEAPDQDASFQPFVRMSRMVRPGVSRSEDTEDLWLSMARDLFGRGYVEELSQRPRLDWEDLVQPATDAQADAKAQEKLGIASVAPAQPFELRPNSTEADKQLVIRAAYKQVFGNTYILESDRLIQAESLLKNGSISVREFVRLLAKSELYKSRFFHSTSNNRFIELNLKHLLGRAPYDQSEISFHLDLYCQKGYDAEIDSYIDSEEYRQLFGEDIVPYYRSFKYQTGQSAWAFDRFRTLYGGDAGSDTDRNKSGQRTQLTTNITRPDLPSGADYASLSAPSAKGPDTVADIWLEAARDLIAQGNYTEKSIVVESNLQLPSYQRFLVPSEAARIDAEAQTKLGITSVAPAVTFELRPNSTEADKQLVIRAAYKQVFGNTYILESDRLIQAESLLKNGSISVREFVRLLAKSELYKSRFFRPASNNRFIELNFKHLLGRAPYSQAEIAEHFGRYHKAGYDAEIDSYLDSEEYRRTFGEDIVPYYRGFKYQTGQSARAFEQLQQLWGGDAGSDTDRGQGQITQLTYTLARPLIETGVVLSAAAAGGTVGDGLETFLKWAQELGSVATPQPTAAPVVEVARPRKAEGYFTRPAADAQADAKAQEKLGIASVAPAQPFELRPNSTEADKQLVIRAAYKQVFGNTYILESDRLIQAESLLKNGSISVREFVRLLAKSELYKSRFFHSTSNNRFIELTFKHLLGRAPYNQSEIAQHLDRYQKAGYDAEIDSYIDSEEYRQLFGEDIVPYYRGFKYQIGQSAAAFPRLLQLWGGDAGSDTDRNQNGQLRRVEPDELLRSGRGIV
ncbi:phycobilisome rod-core linker polypeptide [Gloeobacter kilaueensis]|uniref:Phycobilisome linker polypeptide n=1 Tax=Gloeobacter kilaueensis (strain ATCC BAA-2537 / CCAP 1431/1 / ULC 316 / JS1) TaxID=1183438 RepID=U5QNT1_GLOK1|nr:phycobilisome rod-core linker polypeptide [Gloeobacter kilaueensis]AGY60543.1 phycobilisome linker polypeptide [Gloeobacter kilaueensis JS1]